MCVLFLDIRGFTAMTRTRSADETVALLNDFFAEMIDIVDRNHGIINKFLGDGFLALFGAPLEDPKAAINALAAARGMMAGSETGKGRASSLTVSPSSSSSRASRARRVGSDRAAKVRSSTAF